MDEDGWFERWSQRTGTLDIRALRGQLTKDFVIQPSRSQVYKAKLKACEIIEGSLSTQYEKLWDYAEELKKTNHGSTIVIDTKLGHDDKNKFKRIYISFNACKQARSTKVDDFQTCMAEIKKLNEKTLKWLNEISPSQWSKSFFLVYLKCDMTLNNLCEIVNGDNEVLEARSSPIYSLLEMLRIKIMNRKASRRAEIKRWYKNIGPKISEILDLEAKKSGYFVAHWEGRGHYHVSINQTPIAMVNLKGKNCTAESGI
ncbi:hypothetical protein Dsin_017978 [Dipteronia sinensis]|uniref:Uncharacterized protein n=1 Tax=Dipteronia sinensis TaxID=43782 RepID=A0AAE0AHD3_9ROSI|nr:hypothetical protein Dsin_017978 [Dipteronia sinensis]